MLEGGPTGEGGGTEPPLEATARVQAICENGSGPSGEWILDREYVGVKLTRKEFDLVLHLASSPSGR